jgi:hypothetical protein
MSIPDYDSSELKLLRKAQNEMNRNGQLIFSFAAIQADSRFHTLLYPPAYVCDLNNRTFSSISRWLFSKLPVQRISMVHKLILSMQKVESKEHGGLLGYRAYRISEPRKMPSQTSFSLSSATSPRPVARVTGAAAV